MIVLLSKELILSFISFFSESTAAKTAIIENIPMVTPSKDKNVLSLLVVSALIAKLKLSLKTRKYIIILKFKVKNLNQRFFWYCLIKKLIFFLIKKLSRI
jgi:hypothetical protein